MNQLATSLKHFATATLIALAVAASGSVAAAEPVADPALTWASLPAASRAAFDAGPGRRWEARVRGAHAAVDAVPGDLQTLDLLTRWDNDFTGPDGVEISVDALVSWRLGGLADRRRGAWRAEAEARAAERDLARFTFEVEAGRRFVAWWERQALAEHVAEHLTEQAHFLAPARAAVEKHLVSQLVLSDLEVEVARVEIAATRLEGEVAVAARELQGLLGTELPPSAAGLGELDRVAVDTPNPWEAVRDRLDAHPELRALQAAEVAARARSEAADAEGGASLQVGAGFRRTGSDSTWAAALVGVSIPLGDPAGAEAADLAGEATALGELRAWRLRELRAEVDALATRYTAAVTQLRRVVDALVVPMGDRVVLHERAVLAGRAGLEQLVRARRDLLEAHHDLVQVAAEVLSHQANAAAVAALLTSGGQP